MKCPDCKDGTYTPLVGPPERCKTCKGKVVLGDITQRMAICVLCHKEHGEQFVKGTKHLLWYTCIMGRKTYKICHNCMEQNNLWRFWSG